MGKDAVRRLGCCVEGGLGAKSVGSGFSLELDAHSHFGQFIAGRNRGRLEIDHVIELCVVCGKLSEFANSDVACGTKLRLTRVLGQASQ